MASLKLTKRTVDGAAIGQRDAFLWDEGLRGFGLKVTPAGSKIYLVQYRMGGRGSPTRRFTIGSDGTWSPAAARVEAERLLRLAASGTDPRAHEKDRQRSERDLAFAPYAASFLLQYGKEEWRPRTFVSADSNMRRWVMPVLGRKALPAITKRDIIEVLDRLPSGSPALRRSVFALMRKLFNRAAGRGDIDRSPMENMETPESVAPRDRTLSDEELWFVILCADDVGQPFAAFIKMLIVSGQRRDEVAGMTWSELDRHLLEWTIPASRAKNGNAHVVPISEIALSELDKLAGGDRWPRTGLVFTTTGTTPVSGFSKIKRRLDAAVATQMKREIAPWRLHDLRRTFATNMQRLGVRFEVTEALLNHTSGSRSGVAGVYQQHNWKPEKQEAIQLWTSRLRKLLFDEGLDRFTDEKRGQHNHQRPDKI